VGYQVGVLTVFLLCQKQVVYNLYIGKFSISFPVGSI